MYWRKSSLILVCFCSLYSKRLRRFKIDLEKMRSRENKVKTPILQYFKATGNVNSLDFLIGEQLDPFHLLQLRNHGLQAQLHKFSHIDRLQMDPHTSKTNICEFRSLIHRSFTFFLAMFVYNVGLF